MVWCGVMMHCFMMDCFLMHCFMMMDCFLMHCPMMHHPLMHTPPDRFMQRALLLHRTTSPSPHKLIHELNRSAKTKGGQRMHHGNHQLLDAHKRRVGTVTRIGPHRLETSEDLLRIGGSEWKDERDWLPIQQVKNGQLDVTTSQGLPVGIRSADGSELWTRDTPSSQTKSRQRR